MNNDTKRKQIINSISKYVYTFIITITVFCIVINSDFVYNSKQDVDPILCVIVGLLILAIIIVRKKIKLKKSLIYFSSLMLLIIQILVFFYTYFETGWDVNVVLNDAFRLENAKLYKITYEYYTIHPNNIFICMLLATITRIFRIIGLSIRRQFILGFIVIDCVISNVTCLLVYFLAKKITNERFACIAYLTSIILFGLSPWNIIPYSDSLTLFIPIFILFLYLYIKNHYLKWTFISFLFFVGYNIKPQSIFVVLGIIVYEFFTIERKNVIKTITSLIILIVITLMGNVGLNLAKEKGGFVIDKDKELGISHYLMMGLNKDTYGAYSEEDVNFSLYCIDYKNRTDANVEEIKSRLNNFGIDGYLDFLSKKLIVTFNDGTFSWGKEGDFYFRIYSGENIISDALKSIFYNDGENNYIFLYIEQITWMLVLVGSIFGILDKKIEKENCIIYITLIGLIVFQLLFETRARYLYTNVPLFVVAFAQGTFTITNQFSLKEE